MPSKTSFLEQRQYIDFWRWEYLRRAYNLEPKLQEILSTPMAVEREFWEPWAEGQSEPVVAFTVSALEYVGEAGDFFIQFYDENDQFYLNSSDILTGLSLGIFKYKYPDLINFRGYKSIEVIHPLVKNLPKEVISIDLWSPLKDIIREISHYYHLRNIIIAKDSSEREIHIAGTQEYQLHLSKEINVGLKRVNINNICRAIGIWLWDYIAEKNILWEHRAKAYHAFHAKYHSAASEITIDGYRDDRQLAEQLDLARECIEKMEVLPGS